MGNRFLGAFRQLAAIVASLVACTANAAFYSGNFDPPDLSGTHTFQVQGTDCFTGPGAAVIGVNNGDSNNCTVSLTNLTVLLNHAFPLDFNDFLPFTGINDILMIDDQLAGVNSDLIGPVNVSSGLYAGDWSIQYAFVDSFDPVYLFHNCTDPTGQCVPVDTALVVTFFPSDANGNPIPEPGSVLLVGFALLALWQVRRTSSAR